MVERKNRMHEIASMYGKELYEPFWVANSIDDKKEIFRFTERGMEHFLAGSGYENCFNYRGSWNRNADFFLQHLITGEIWIVEKYEQENLFG